MSVSATASADDISGVISATRTITRDSQLVGDVTCMVTGAACIAIGASGVTLDLNGFSIIGQGDAATGCAGAQTAGENGVVIAGQRGVIARQHVPRRCKNQATRPECFPILQGR